MPPVWPLTTTPASTSSEPIPRTIASAKKTERAASIQKIGLR